MSHSARAGRGLRGAPPVPCMPAGTGLARQDVTSLRCYVTRTMSDEGRTPLPEWGKDTPEAMTAAPRVESIAPDAGAGAEPV
jgi:hypothetical protein